MCDFLYSENAFESLHVRLTEVEDVVSLDKIFRSGQRELSLGFSLKLKR